MKEMMKMQKMKETWILVVTIASVLLLVSSVVNTYADTQEIWLNGNAWNKKGLTIDILLDPTDSGWKDSYATDVEAGVLAWASSLPTFTFTVNVINSKPPIPPPFDVYIHFAMTSTNWGSTIENYANPNTDFHIVWVDTLLVWTIGAVTLNDAQMTSLAAHEFGHALGLGHTNFAITTPDVMDAQADPTKWSSSPSALDNYGLSIVYAWLSIGTFKAPAAGYVAPPNGSSVGGIVVPVDKLGLLAPYIGLVSTILFGTVASTVCVKRVKRRKEKQ
jgi:hypothetical protein